MKKPPYIVTANGISIVWDGKPYNIGSDNPSFAPLKKVLLDADYERVPEYLDMEKRIEDFSSGNLHVKNGEVFYGSYRLHGVVVDKLLQFLKQGMKDAEPIVNFINKLMANPSNNSVEQLYTFLSYKLLPLTEDGNVIGYKGVQDDYYSHSGNKNTIVLQGTVSECGRILNKVGETIEVARRSVDDNKDNHCSHGLHVGSYDYARDWAGSAGRLLMVEFDPADAVSVPTDCSFQKLRVSKYKVIGEVPIEKKSGDDAPLKKAYYGKGEGVEIEIEDGEEECADSYCGCDCDDDECGISDEIVLKIRDFVEVWGQATVRQVQGMLRESNVSMSCEDILEVCEEDLGLTVDKWEEEDVCNWSVIWED